MKKISLKNKFISIITIIFSLYAITGFILIPVITKALLPEKLGEILNRDVKIEKINLNPFTMSLKLKNFKILTKRQKRNFFSFNEFYINIDFVSSILSLAPVIAKLTISSPSLYVERVEKNKFNFSDLLKNKADKNNETNAKPANPFEFFIKGITITNGGLTFNDTFIKSKQEIKHFDLYTNAISNFEKYKDIPVSIFILSSINKAKFNLNINSQPFSKSLHSKIGINLNHLDLTHFYPYIKNMVNFIPKNGSISIKTDLNFKKNKQNKPELDIKGKGSLDNFDIEAMNKGKILSFKNFSFEVNKSYPLKNQINIKTLKLADLKLHVKRQNKAINILNLLKKTHRSKKTEDKKNGKPFIVNINSIVMRNGATDFTDFDAPLVKSGFYKKPIVNNFSDINLKLSSFSTIKNSKSDLSLKINMNNKTDIDISGNFSINPVLADINTKINNFNLNFSKGYIPPGLKILVKNGELTFNAKNKIRVEKDKLKFSMSSDISLKKLNIVERKIKNKLFSLNSFAVKGLDFNFNPMSLDIDEIDISGINHNISIDKKGEPNFKRVLPQSSSEKNKKASKKKKKELFPIKISIIKMDNINLNYKDQSLSPYFATTITLNSGRIKNLSTNAFHDADVDIKGNIDKNSHLKIKGKINPFLKNRLVDLKLNLQDMDLTKFTPYSGKYIGRGIKKGQLNLNLYYDIKKKQLNAKNQVFLDQFTLGRKIKSKDASNLPVGLAIALLKDRKGEIRLNIPVSGSLDDPKFKVGKVILQVLKNLVVKAVTSPFALVASITGGGEDLKFIEFKYGGAILKQGSEKKLNAIEKLLFERPGLKLDIKGYSNKNKDIYALKKLEFKNIIKNKKIDLGMDITKKLNTEEYTELLKDILKKRTDIDLKPENKKNSIAFMTEKIKSTITFSDEDLRFMSLLRAKKVKEYLLKNKNINTSRIFLNDTAEITPEKKNNISSARVVIKIR